MAQTRTDQLIRQTQRRLFIVTLALLVLLVLGVGTATLLVGLSSLDADVDRALAAAVDAQVASLQGELPADGDPAESGSGEGGSGTAGEEAAEHRPAVADTTLVVLDPTGGVRAITVGTKETGIPDLAAVKAAGSDADLRTISAGNRNLRVLTIALLDGETVTGYVQGAFDLTLHDRQSRSLVLAVLAVGVLALLAAAIITLLLTRRALVPIREGFEAQRRFVADASHELRTPAALIRANAEVLEREGLVADGGRDLLADVIGEADRLGGLVGDLVQLAAWDETRMALALADCDVTEVVRDTVRGATAFGAERGVALEVDGPPGAIVSADRPRLVQLLLVLVDNAVDHSPSGGTVTLRVTQGPSKVWITVDDQGPGIAPADRERIFEPFTRLPGTTRHGSGGTGLGLAIARRIADAHGGTIEAGSTPEGGARFVVTLPASG